MKSAVRRVLLLSALLSPNALYALGLGEIHLHSGLNQPFDADIDLVSAADEDLSAFRATLASNDTFARYGLDKPAYLSEFTFKVYRSSSGKDVLKVSSLQPVTEPFVTLLVEADWPRGKLLREYTVLLDPPIYAPASQTAERPVSAPRVQGGAGQQAPAPAPRPEPSKPAAAPSVPAAEPAAATGSTAAAGSTYRVRPNDTLWKIASEAHPGTRSDVNRAMVAIYQANEHAFAGNINVLRSGSLLRIPEASAVQAISASAAAEEVSRQYRLWREGASAAEPGAATGRLRLVTPEQGTASASTATAPAPTATPGAGASAPELQARVQQLESQLAEARRLLEVRNAELATLQGQTAASQPGAAPPAAPATPAPGAAAAAGATSPAAGQPEPTPSTQPAAAAQPQPATPPKPAAAPPQPKKPAPAAAEPTLGERLAGFWWVALGLLAAALAVLFYRRSRGESGEKEANLQEALGRSRMDLRSRAPVEREAAIVVEERRPAEPAAVAKAAAAPSAAKAAPGPRAPEPTRKPPSVDDTISGEGPVSIDAGDPLAEADFHMAYGLYDQAADLVQLAMKRSPQRRDLKLKLLEIFFVWGNKDRFLEVAREMNATRGEATPAEWDKILIMGKQIAPEDPLFAGAASQLESSLDMELHGSQGPLDMDLGADQGSTPDVEVSVGVAGAAAGDSLDFDLGDATHAEATAPTIETPRIRAKPGASEEPTQEVPIEDLGLDVGDLGSLDAGGEDSLTVKTKAMVEDTVERPRISAKALPGDEGEDLLDATGILKDQTGVLKSLEITGEVPEIDLSDRTGELPTIETMKLPADSPGGLNLSFTDEPTTMSEVGTKLDLARAYVDMGDPEGARSILDEVLKEGSPQQKQEAERLLASLP